MKTRAPRSSHARSFEECVAACRTASRSQTAIGVVDPKSVNCGRRRFCMLCIHCPKCEHNPQATCDLCAACQSCSLYGRG